MKKLVPILMAAVALVACAGLTGCPAVNANTQQQAAQLVAVLGQSVANLAAVENMDPATIAKIKLDTAAATAAIAGWTSGSPSTEIIEGLNLVADDLNLLPLNPQDKVLIDFAIGTADSILILFPSPAASPATAHAVVMVQRRSVTLAQPPRTAAAFQKQWNALLAQQPALAGAAIR